MVLTANQGQFSPKGKHHLFFFKPTRDNFLQKENTTCSFSRYLWLCNLLTPILSADIPACVCHPHFNHLRSRVNG
ncbi:hypothetical protein SRHO_G00205690 [Serrasalmus rhombeus]